MKKPVKLKFGSKGTKVKNANSYAQKEEPPGEEKCSLGLSSSLEENLGHLREIFAKSTDIIFRDFTIGRWGRLRAAVVYVDGLINITDVNENLLKAVMLEMPMAGNDQDLTKLDVLQKIKDSAFPLSQVKEATLIEQVVDAILSGDTAFLLDGYSTALLVGARGWETRSLDEPATESVVRGPREGFVETLRINTSLIRRKIKSSDLKIEMMKLGRATQTDIGIAYMENLATQELVSEVKKRLQQIDTDSILESGYLEEFIEDNPYSLFSQVNRTERPDKVAAGLLEGRIAILVDGTPFALIVPALFIEFLQASEDYYERYMISSFVRLLRYAAFMVSLLLPSLYIAITTFHQEMLPTDLLLSIAAQREGVPFPAFVEALLMEISFEALREAGIRLPRPIGQAVSIVGALVIGEASVSAGIVSPAMVIIVAVTGISSFIVPNYAMAISMRLLRFALMILAASLGLFGIMAGLIAIVIHLATLRSFGMPYLSPIVPTHPAAWKDTVIRTPWWTMLTRPPLIKKGNLHRQRPYTRRWPGQEQGGEANGRKNKN